jgi:hypothetical protein
MPLDEADRRALVSVRNLGRVVVVILVLLLLVQGIPTLLGFIASRRAARSLVPDTTPPTPGSSPGGPATIERGAAGTIRTNLGYGIVLNKDSSLEREWVTVNSPTVPAKLVGAAPVVTTYKSAAYSGTYQYEAQFEIDAQEALSAIEVKFLTFDVWGDHKRSLSSTDVLDVPAGRRKVSAAWPLHSENEASEHYASIAYVARVRTKQGRVIAADLAPVIAEAKKFSAKFNPASLEDVAPSPLPPPPTAR